MRDAGAPLTSAFLTSSVNRTSSEPFHGTQSASRFSDVQQKHSSILTSLSLSILFFTVCQGNSGVSVSRSAGHFLFQSSKSHLSNIPETFLKVLSGVLICQRILPHTNKSPPYLTLYSMPRPSLIQHQIHSQAQSPDTCGMHRPGVQPRLRLPLKYVDTSYWSTAQKVLEHHPHPSDIPHVHC